MVDHHLPPGPSAGDEAGAPACEAMPGHAATAAADLVAPVAFSTRSFAPRDRFDAWVSHFGRLNDVDVPPDRRAGFEASSAAWGLGGLLVTSNTIPAMRMRRTPRHARRDGLDHWVLRVARRGRTRSRFGDATLGTAPRQVVLFSLADGFDGEWADSEWVSLSFARDDFPALSGGLAALPQGPQGGVGADLLAEFVLALPGHLARARCADLPTIAEAARAMVASCLPSGGRAVAPAPDVPSPLLRERVRQIVRRSIGSPSLTPERICREAGISRSSLYRAFEAEGGVARYVQRVRLSLVHAALCDPARAAQGIAALAEAHGFHDASAFSRTFRRAYGRSPGEARAAARLGGPPAVPEGRRSAVPGDDFAALLHRLGGTARVG